MVSCVLGSLLALSAVASVASHSIPIEPGVAIPYVNLGTGSGQKGDVANATMLWIQAGGIGIDTAYIYGDETEVAKGISAAHASASSLFVTTKVPCGSYQSTTKKIKRNLQQLNVYRVDLLLIHSPLCGPLTSVAETWRAIEDAKSAGLTRAIGVSNFVKSHFEELATTQREAPVINQDSLSVSFHDDETIEYCKGIGVTYMAYSPLCGGFNGSSCSHGSVLSIPEVNTIAQAHNVSAAQVALKWVVQQGHPLACASWNQAYMKEDLDLWSWGELSAAEMTTLHNVKPPSSLY